MSEKHPTNQASDRSVLKELELSAELPCKIKPHNYSIIKVSGSDAPVFLQGQLTGDCKSIEPEHSLLMAWCTPNGRVQNLIHVIRSGDLFFLLIPKEQMLGMVKKLKMFVLRSDVEVEDLSTDYELFLTLNSNQSDTSFATIGRQDSRCWWIVPNGKATKVWKGIAAQQVNEDVIEFHSIVNGIPYLTEELTDTFLPQEIGLEELKGLSFSKGCYPGQEIIARVKYRGKVKRELVKISVVATEEIPSAARLFGKSDTSVGLVLRSVTTGKGTHQLLAVLNCGIDQVVLPSMPDAVLEMTPMHI
jgi:folate-binding protein YgfZ